MKEELNELIGALREEGVKKGEQEAIGIVSNAKRDAAKIIDEARGEADKILEGAKRNAQATMSHLDQQIALALRDLMLKAKEDLTELVALKPLRRDLGKNLSDPAFLKKLICKIVSSYLESDRISTTTQVHITIPDDMKDTFVQYWKTLVHEELKIQGSLHTEKGLQGCRLFFEGTGGELIVDTDSILEMLKSFVSERFHAVLDAQLPA